MPLHRYCIQGLTHEQFAVSPRSLGQPISVANELVIYYAMIFTLLVINLYQCVE